MKKHTLTQSEVEVMKAIPQDNFYEGGFESVLWTNIMLDDAGFEPKKARGILASLIKKEMITVTDQGEGDKWSRSTLELLPAGIEWLKEESGLAFGSYGELIRQPKVKKVEAMEEVEIEEAAEEVELTDSQRIMKALEDLNIEGLEIAQLKNSIMVVLPE